MTARLTAAPQQFNIADICTRQHCEAGRGDKVAFRWLTGSLERTDYSFADLERESNRFANVLLGLGIGAGDICFTLLPKMPQQFFAFLGILKMQGLAGTLFANFGPEALLDRLGDSGAKCLITKKSLLKRVRPILSQLPSLTHIIVVDIPDHESETVLSYGRLMEAASSEFEAPLTPPGTPSVLHYTSGSTGKPKGVVHVHRSVLSQRATGAEVLGLGEDDVYWCTADQGWVTGTSYGIIAPWSLGVTQVHFAGGYDAEMWFRILEQERVNVWYSAPTALRMLMKEDPELFRGFDLSSLRHIFSVGEPLNPEVIQWSRRVLDRDVYDTWFQTETGSIMVSNRPGLPIKPGSMGKPVTGVEAAVIDGGGAQAPVKAVGHLSLRPGWPSMFVTYLNNEAAYQKKFANDYYDSGDTAYQDEEGYFWFVGRSDDVINTAGHLISPFEIESALLEIEEIAESGVIGAPDDLLFEKVVAFVCLKEGYEWNDELELKIRLYLANKVSSIATPQELVVVDAVPKNKSGKIMRRVLKAQYLGQDPGDLSTLEAD